MARWEETIASNLRVTFLTARAFLRHAAVGRGGALESVVDRFYPGRTKTLRPINPQEFKATTVIRMKIEEASAKVRAKNVADDEEDYGLPLWAGVIPVAQVIGAEEPCPRLIPGTARPENLSAYRKGRRLDETFVQMQRAYEQDGER